MDYQGGKDKLFLPKAKVRRVVFVAPSRLSEIKERWRCELFVVSFCLLLFLAVVACFLWSFTLYIDCSYRAYMYVIPKLSSY